MKMNNQMKVKTVESYSDSQVSTNVCRGKLVLIPHIGGSSIKAKYSIIVNYRICRPIIISETEEIEVGDIVFHQENDGNLYIIDKVKEITIDPKYGKVIILNMGGFIYYTQGKKILALLEQFSPKHLSCIIEGKIKDGDLVLIEVEKL